MRYLEAAALTILAVFAPIQAAILAALGLVLADLIIGILAARKRGEPITSAGIRRTITKIFVYEAALMLGFLTEKYMIGDLVPVSKLVAGLIGAVELKSILESLDEINGTPLLGALIKQLGSKNDQS